MFHVKHRGAARRCRRRRSAGRRGTPSGTGLILSSCPFVPTGSLPGRWLRAAPRPRSRVDPSSPRHISSPLHRPHRATPSHAGAPRISSSARSPLIASIRPPARSSGMLHLVSLSNDATALETTASISPTCCRTDRSSARPRTIVTSRPSSSTTSRRNSLRRSSGSMSVTRRSGRANANGIPGRPAPLPMSAIRSLGIEQFGHRRAIQYVAVPQPVHFAGPEQSPLHAGAGEDLGVPLGALDPRIRRGPRRLAAPRTPPHVSRETSSGSRGPERRRDRNYIGVTLVVSRAERRRDATARRPRSRCARRRRPPRRRGRSCARTASSARAPRARPISSTRCATLSPSAANSSRRRRRHRAMSSISRLRSPVF